jgi:hypothetical protein
MKKVRICNRCYNLFKDKPIRQYAKCPACKKGEIIHVEEEVYFKACSNDKEMDDFKATMVEYGSQNSRRRIDIRCSFRTKKEAEKVCTEIESNGLGSFMNVSKGEKAWIVKGSTMDTLKEVPNAIITIEKVIKKYHPVEFDGWVTTRFVD